jgi:hypothetical protein
MYGNSELSKTQFKFLCNISNFLIKTLIILHYFKPFSQYPNTEKLWKYRKILNISKILEYINVFDIFLNKRIMEFLWN